MIEENNPIDIGKKLIAEYKDFIEEMLAQFAYKGKTYSLADMILQMDPEEKYVMSNLERDTYLTIREGLQIFKAVSELLSDKTGLKQKLISLSSSELLTNPDLEHLRTFSYNFATFAASKFVVKKMSEVIKQGGEIESSAKPDLSVLSLESGKPEATVIKRLLAPVYANLVKNQETGDIFKTPFEFPFYVKNVFEKYVELVLTRKNEFPELLRHVDGYNFRIMDEFLILKGYEDKTIQQVSVQDKQTSFQPIKPHEIVGNQSAKRKIVRTIERLALYDVKKQMNPVIELGGLIWSAICDGLPGTGKSSMFRLAMTILKERAEALGLNYHIFTIDQSIKDEFYGKTGKLLLQKFSITKDPNVICLGIFDDIDLLTSSRDDAQGADNDINNIIMQYMDGVFTVRRGNVTNFAASNKPTGLDDALRNRFNDRLLVDGPKTSEDFADMLFILTEKLRGHGLLKIDPGYKPMSTQDIRNNDGTWSGENVSEYMAEEFKKYKSSTILDFGKFLAGLKEKNPKITGRSTKAIVESIKERSADFDIPQDWFSNKSIFFEKPYEEKIKVLSELYKPITPDILFQEAKRYFDSESRFVDTENEGHINKGYNNLSWDIQSQIRYYENQISMAENADMLKLHNLKNIFQEKISENEKTVRNILQKKTAN